MMSKSELFKKKNKKKIFNYSAALIGIAPLRKYLK